MFVLNVTHEATQAYAGASRVEVYLIFFCFCFLSWSFLIFKMRLHKLLNVDQWVPLWTCNTTFTASFESEGLTGRREWPFTENTGVNCYGMGIPQNRSSRFACVDWYLKSLVFDLLKWNGFLFLQSCMSLLGIYWLAYNVKTFQGKYVVSVTECLEFLVAVVCMIYRSYTCTKCAFTLS